MRPLYAVQFEIARRESSPLGTLGIDVLQRVAAWITDWYSTRLNVDVDVRIPLPAFSPVFGHDLEVTQDTSQNSETRHTVANWSYPDDKDGNLYWNSRVEIGEFDHRVEFSFQLSIDSAQALISPFEFSLRRPRIVGVLLRDFLCTCGVRELSSDPKEIDAGGIGEFVTGTILSQTRRLPVILVSRTTQSESTLVDPLRIADRLAGIAETYCLTDKWAAFALTDSIGKTYSCYNGAIRVYWPGFDPAGSPYSPVYLPEHLLQVGDRITEDLFRQFAGISAFRFVRGPVTTDAIEQLQAERAAETEKLKNAAKEKGDLSELLDLASQENDELLNRNDSLRTEIISLKASLELAHENFRVISQSYGAVHADNGSGVAPVQAPDATEPETVEDAVLMARDAFDSTLIFQASAIASAHESPYKQANRVYQAFLAMHEVCIAWRDSLKKQTSMGTFESAFERKGFEYRPRESMTTRGKWGDEYETIYKGQCVSIEQHLALGKGGPDTCLRIHFYIDGQDHKFVIAHVGRHKTNTRT
jgi:hypothetical protein